MNDNDIEQEIQTKGLTAPRVTPTDIENNILSEHYFTANKAINGLPNKVGFNKTENGKYIPVYASIEHQALSLLTFCVLVLKNGFTVTGESACASPENFDAELGRKIARQNAVSKIWPLMGYKLKCDLMEGK
ncbi:MAG: Gp49 family protein [Acinetobacter junii]